MTVYFFFPGALAWAKVGLPPLTRWAGLVIMVIMWPLFIWIFGNLGTNVTPTVLTRSSHKLVQQGPYKYIRHPMYVVAVIFFAGFSLLANNWLIASCAYLAIIALALRVPLEEKKLIERFGEEYLEYMRRTGRYFPKFSLMAARGADPKVDLSVSADGDLANF